jgi:hypothetical protein
VISTSVLTVKVVIMPHVSSINTVSDVDLKPFLWLWGLLTGSLGCPFYKINFSWRYRM